MSKNIHLLFLIISFLGCALQHVVSQFPEKEWNLHSLHWKCGFLAPGLPERSLYLLTSYGLLLITVYFHCSVEIFFYLKKINQWSHIEMECSSISPININGNGLSLKVFSLCSQAFRYNLNSRSEGQVCLVRNYYTSEIVLSSEESLQKRLVWALPS